MKKDQDEVIEIAQITLRSLHDSFLRGGRVIFLPNALPDLMRIVQHCIDLGEENARQKKRITGLRRAIERHAPELRKLKGRGAVEAGE